MLTYLFRAVFINLYFKTKHSSQTFHLGFFSLSKVFSYRKHISSKRNIRLLTISGKSINIKIIAPPLTLLSTTPSILWYSLNIPWVSFYYDLPPILRYFSGTPTPLPAYSTPTTIKHRRVGYWKVKKMCLEQGEFLFHISAFCLGRISSLFHSNMIWISKTKYFTLTKYQLKIISCYIFMSIIFWNLNILHHCNCQKNMKIYVNKERMYEIKKAFNTFEWLSSRDIEICLVYYRKF